MIRVPFTVALAAFLILTVAGEREARAAYAYVCVCDGAAPPGMHDRALMSRNSCGYGFQPGDHGRREIVRASVILRRYLRPEIAYRAERGETVWDHVTGWRCMRQ